MEIETVNDCMVSCDGKGNIVVQRMPPRMTRAQALRMAAWIVAIADDRTDSPTFDAILEAVKNS